MRLDLGNNAGHGTHTTLQISHPLLYGAERVLWQIFASLLEMVLDERTKSRLPPRKERKGSIESREEIQEGLELVEIGITTSTCDKI